MDIFASTITISPCVPAGRSISRQSLGMAKAESLLGFLLSNRHCRLRNVLIYDPYDASSTPSRLARVDRDYNDGHRQWSR